MLKDVLSIISVLIIFSLPACSQVEKENVSKGLDSLGEGVLTEPDTLSAFVNPSYYQYDDTWVELAKGVSYIERTAPDSSKIGDSKISILKMDPNAVEFEFKSALQNDSQMLCAVDYADKFDYNVVINAGMYSLKYYLKSKGLLINNKDFANNPKLYPGYNMMICANPQQKDLPNINIVDLTEKPFQAIQHKYESFSQGLRMISGSGEPMNWSRRPQSCSQLIVAKDDEGFIYFIFTRSPYTQSYMIKFMMSMGLKNAVYMEGGPQTSMFIDVNGHRIEKVGSYVSNTYPTNNNKEFWKLPNIIGLRIKGAHK